LLGLPVEIDEPVRQLLELLKGGCLAIDAGSGSTGEPDASFDLEAAAVNGEGSLDGGTISACGDDFSPAAATKDECEGVDDQGFASARFAGEDVQTRPGFKDDRASYREVGDGDPFKHAG
jgi:hypothetical protein